MARMTISAVSSSGLIFQIGGGEAPLLIKDPFHGPEFEAADLALPSQDLLDAPPVADLHAFLLGLCHFPGGSRHLFPGFERDQGDLAPLAPGRPGHVHGHVAAADDRHLLALEIELLTRGRVFEIFDAPEDSLGVGAGHRQADGILRPDAQEDRPEAFGGEQIVDGAAGRADGGVIVDLHPQALDDSPLPVAGLPWAGGIPECRSAASRRPPAAASKITA